MSGHSPAAPLTDTRYRMAVGGEERKIPASGIVGGAAKIVAWHAGRSKLFPGAFRRAYERLDRGRALTAVRLEFAEGFFDRKLVIDVDPLRLDHMLIDAVTFGPRATRLAHWFLDAGIWDDAVLPIAQSEVDQEIGAVFEPEGYRASEAYDRLVAAMTAGTPAVRNAVALETGRLVHSYFRYYERLRDSIGKHGVLRRDELRGTGIAAAARSSVRPRRSEERERDVGVAIDATGRLLRTVGGRHRTAIAQRLRLPSIPVQVRLVHARWLRAQVAATGLPPDLALLSGLEAIARGTGRDAG